MWGLLSSRVQGCESLLTLVGHNNLLALFIKLQGCFLKNEYSVYCKTAQAICPSHLVPTSDASNGQALLKRLDITSQSISLLTSSLVLLMTFCSYIITFGKNMHIFHSYLLMVI